MILLIYGMEAVLPFEVEVPSLRILAESGLKESEWDQTRYDQLNLIEGKRLTAMSHGRLYQQRMKSKKHIRQEGTSVQVQRGGPRAEKDVPRC